MNSVNHAHAIADKILVGANLVGPKKEKMKEPTEKSEPPLLDESSTSLIVAETESDTDDDDDDGGLASFSYLFEGNQPGIVETFRFQGLEDAQIMVSIHRIDDDPGALQSGHYLWPAAKPLAEYLVSDRSFLGVSSMLELGAGCALVSLSALQALQASLQAIVISDHDPSTLDRARDNYETTLEHMMDSVSSEEDLDTTINYFASVPVEFRGYTYGESVTGLIKAMDEHVVADDAGGQDSTAPLGFDLVVGSDLIYDLEVVRPLFMTINDVMKSNSCRCVLSQSFDYDAEVDEAISAQCSQHGLVRSTVAQDGVIRIQEFRRRPIEDELAPS